MAWVIRRRPRKNAGGERGQALLEMVPVAALLLTVIFGVIECSYAIWQVEVIAALTREGSNLASRNTALPAAATAVIHDCNVINLSGNGEVIVTAVQNLSGTFTITGQTSSGSFTASSRVGSGVGASATIPAIPATATPPAVGAIPLNGSIYVTEVFTQYTAITPLGAFVKLTLPSTLYDVAYF